MKITIRIETNRSGGLWNRMLTRLGIRSAPFGEVVVEAPDDLLFDPKAVNEIVSETLSSLAVSMKWANMTPKQIVASRLN